MDSLSKNLRVAMNLVVTVFLLSACGGTPVKPDDFPNDDSLYTTDVFDMSELAEDAYQESRWADAAQYYQQLTNSVPEDAYIWFRLGNTYVQKGEYKQAIRAYEISIDRDGLQPKPWFNLSTTYLLNAKSALLQSKENLRIGDPARELIMHRITSLDTLLNKEIEDIRVARNP